MENPLTRCEMLLSLGLACLQTLASPAFHLSEGTERGTHQNVCRAVTVLIP